MASKKKIVFILGSGIGVLIIIILAIFAFMQKRYITGIFAAVMLIILLNIEIKQFKKL